MQYLHAVHLSYIMTFWAARRMALKRLRLDLMWTRSRLAARSFLAGYVGRLKDACGPAPGGECGEHLHPRDVRLYKLADVPSTASLH